ncbi:hypothetical protein ZWY2020_029205 [Hordeum vulgare]|nr:hypothetical protein ZWY2020_029205 [Hordeum vulgare]
MVHIFYYYYYCLNPEMIFLAIGVCACRWSAIATHLPKRTDNEIKNYWNTHLKKWLAKMGIDPVTHKPTRSGGVESAAARSTPSGGAPHTAQWESQRLEAARLGA